MDYAMDANTLCLLSFLSLGTGSFASRWPQVPIGRETLEDLLGCDVRYDGYCAWQAEGQTDPDRFHWGISDGNWGGLTGPSSGGSPGHPDQSGSYNYFFQIDTRTHRYGHGDHALLTSPVITATRQNACLRFWYYMHGYDVGHLNVWKFGSEGGKSKLFGAFGPLGPRWYQAVVPVGKGNNFTLKIEGTYTGSLGLGNIAVDDIAFQEDDSCLAKEVDSPQFNCNFDRDFCSWKTFGIWNRMKYDLYKPGFFLAVDHRRYHSNDNSDYLQSPTISVIGPGACLGFSYSLGRYRYDHLAVLKVPYGNRLLSDCTQHPLSYYPSDCQQNETEQSQELARFHKVTLGWRRVFVTLPRGENYYVVLKVEAGSASIDDISVTHSGPCQSSSSDAVQLSSYPCDFDDGHPCLWSQRPLPGVGRWKASKGPTSTTKTGPDQDHTTGSGYFLYLDAYRVNRAQLYSPVVTVPSHGACLSFWYHMYGQDVNTLTVWRYKHDMEFVEARKKIVLAEIRGNQGNQWLQYNVTFPPGKNTAVVLEAVRGYFMRGDIGIDDLLLDMEGPCPFETPNGSNKTDSIFETTTGTGTESGSDHDTGSSSGSSSVTSSGSGSESGSETGSGSESGSGAGSGSGKQPDIAIPTPVVEVFGQSKPALIGSRLVLVCGDLIYGGVYQWNIANFSRRFNGSSASGHQLILEVVEADDANSYRCLVNANGIWSNYSDFLVLSVVEDTTPKPDLTIYGITDPAVVGSDLLLTCGAEIPGAELEYKWSFYGANGSFFASQTKSRFLVLEGIQPNHTGYFRCAVSKGDLSSGTSNPVKVNVVRGRPCQKYQDCIGDSYTGRCIRSRCVCRENDLMLDTGCAGRPPTPYIEVMSSRAQIDIGDSIHLSCRSREPIKELATFQFQKDGKVLPRNTGTEVFHIHSLHNVTTLDSGNYSCNIFYGGVSSYDSKPRRISVHDLPDLTCNFEVNTCDWDQNNDKSIGVFKLAGEEGTYIRVDPSAGQSSAAILRSPFQLPLTGEVCLSFQYRVQGGPLPSSLSAWVYTKSQDDRKFDRLPVGRVLWETVTGHGAAWIRHELEIVVDSAFSIVFKAQGNIALDDIRFFYQGECEDTPSS